MLLNIMPSTGRKAKATKHKVLYPRLDENSLREYGYTTSKNKDDRRRALDKAVMDYGTVKVMHRLNTLYNLSHHVTPSKSAIFMRDLRHMQNKYKK